MTKPTPLLERRLNKPPYSWNLESIMRLSMNPTRLESRIGIRGLVVLVFLRFQILWIDRHVRDIFVAHIFRRLLAHSLFN